MNLKDDEEQLMRSYLLGALSEEEKLRVEERFFTDSDFYEQMLAVENELKYDYAEGHLSGQEKILFEDRFLKSPESQRGAKMAGILLKKVSEAAPPVVQSDSGSWLHRLMSAIKFQSPAAQYALVALALVMVATSAWLIYRTAHLRSELEQAEIARVRAEEQMERLLAEERARSDQLAEELERERNKQGSSPDKIEKPVSATVSIALRPGIEREGGKIKRLQLLPEVEQVRIQLDVRAEGEYQSFRASLQTADGEEIWSRSRLKARIAPSGRFVFLAVDATILDAGDYAIILKGVTSDRAIEDAGDYYLTIVRK
ncbi:MAG: hypothetical protein AB1631_22050 [Acidobacteriota bacterium]